MTIIGSNRDSAELESHATLTDSYISDMDRLDENLIENSFSEGGSFMKEKKSKKQNKKL